MQGSAVSLHPRSGGHVRGRALRVRGRRVF